VPVIEITSPTSGKGTKPAEEGGMLAAEYGAAGEFLWRRVIVDPAAGTVTFHRCHQPGRFLSWGVEAEYTCRLSELRGVCWSGWRGIGPTLEVVTPAGRARLPQVAANFEAVRAAVVGGLKPGAALPWYEYPAAQALLLLLIVVPGVVLGLGLVIWLLQQPLVPSWVVPVVVLGPVLLIFLIPIVSWWRGRPPR
jgi:hypothetical protein